MTGHDPRLVAPPDLEATLVTPASGWLATRGATASTHGAVAPDAPDAPVAPVAPDTQHAHDVSEAIEAEVPGRTRAAPAHDEGLDPPARPIAGRNPLLSAALPLLDATLALRRGRPAAGVPLVRERLLRAVRDFELHASARGVSPGHRHAARYVLCTMLDEVVARTSWGRAADWTRHGLLVSLHREGFGGERFFTMAERALTDPSRHADLLELMSLMIALGFQGRHAFGPEREARLASWRERLATAARRARPAPADEIVDTALPCPVPAPALGRRIASRGRPGTIAALLLGSCLVAAVLADREIARRFDAQAAPLVATLRTLDAAVPMPSRPLDARTSAPPAPRPRLPALLREDIDAGRLEVDDDGRQARVTLLGDRLYDPAETDVRADRQPLLARIAQAIDQVPGTVVVAGHTDDRPLRITASLPSNAALSLARAHRVADLLAAGLREPSRLRVEGWADTRPRVPNTSEANRARNRRVDITVETTDADPIRSR